MQCVFTYYDSSVFNKRNRQAASLIRLNSIQNACTSINKSFTLIILFLINDCKNTHTRRTKRFCMYLSLIFSQLEMQFEIYKCMNSVGNSTAVVKRFTTSIECKDISIFTKADRYSCSWRLLLCFNFIRHLMATIGLFSTKAGNRFGESPDW